MIMILILKAWSKSAQHNRKYIASLIVHTAKNKTIHNNNGPDSKDSKEIPQFLSKLAQHNKKSINSLVAQDIKNKVMQNNNRTDSTDIKGNPWYLSNSTQHSKRSFSKTRSFTGISGVTGIFFI